MPESKPSKLEVAVLKQMHPNFSFFEFSTEPNLLTLHKKRADKTVGEGQAKF